MGLKTKNYEIKSSGIIYPEVYAVCKSVSNTRGQCTAVFAVSTTRENAMTKAAIKTVEIDFKSPVGAEVDLFKLAYETAKSIVDGERFDYELNTMVTYKKKMPFYGWEDDIQNDNQGENE